MNNIFEKQNEIVQINRLAAQRYLYSRAKVLFIVRLFVSLLVAIVAPILMFKFSNTQFYVAVFAFFYFLFDLLFLRRIESESRCDAAKIQELFDLELFGLDWNSITIGEKVDEEKVLICADKYKKNNKKLDNLYNWYPESIRKVDLYQAVAICQRTNVWWDVSLRKKLFWSVVSFMALLTFVLFMLGKNLPNSVLFIFPFLPFYEIVLNYASSQFSSIQKISNLKNKIEDLLSKKDLFLDVIKIIVILRAIQDAIFLHRESCLFIPDWFYKIFRNKQESQMNYSADFYVNKFLIS